MRRLAPLTFFVLLLCAPAFGRVSTHEQHAEEELAPPEAAGHADHGMRGLLGGYGMTRDASGTSWQPDSTPMAGIHGNLGEWSTMVHEFATTVYDDQGGPRGDTKTFTASML